MKKYIIQTTLISTTIVILSGLFSASSFADTTSTGTTSTGTTSTGTTSTGTTSTGTTSTGTTSTGTTSTGTTATGTTATGTTSTGTTSTGTTSTGVNCNTASGMKAAYAAIQQAFLVEMTRLINEKGAAYTSAMSLSGSLKTDAIKAANEKFRIGVQNAIKTRESAKQNKSNYQCKEPKKVECTTASGMKAELAAIQQAFLVEMTRLINEKGAAYTSAMSLSGSLKTDAIKAANEKFRIGVQNAIKTRESAKQNKSNYQCKEPKKEDYSNRNLEKHNDKYDDKKHNDRNDDKKEIKNQIKDLKKDVKKYIKKYSSNKRDRR